MTAPTTLDYHRQMPFVYGRTVAWYLIALGLASIGRTIVGAFFFDALNIDFTFIFLFWAAYGLMKRRAVVRKIVIVVSGLSTLLIACLVCWKAFIDPDGVWIQTGKETFLVPNTPLVLVVGGLLMLLASVPFVILITTRAREEFKRTS